MNKEELLINKKASKINENKLQRPVQSEINEKVPPEFDKLIDKAIQSLPKDD